MNTHLGQPDNLLYHNISCTGNLVNEPLNFKGLLAEQFHILPEYFYCQVGPHTGDQFIESHLNGLGKFIFNARDDGQRLFKLIRQFIFIGGSNPFLEGLQFDDHIRFFHRHGIRWYLRCTDARYYLIDFRKRE